MSLWNPKDSGEVESLFFLIVVITIALCCTIGEVGDTLAKANGYYDYSEDKSGVSIKIKSSGNTNE
jgi:hypothetical protein